jgi:hypothetical protein
MSEINNRLKSELNELILKLDIALKKFKDRKEKDRLRGASGYGASMLINGNNG